MIHDSLPGFNLVDYRPSGFISKYKRQVNVPFLLTGRVSRVHGILVGLAVPHTLAYKQHFKLRFTAFTIRRTASGKETHEKKEYQ